MKTGFFAYPSLPTQCTDVIESAIELINSSYDVNLRSWRSLDISGKIIITEILKEIDDCDFFCADISGINENILFELGYAISKKKPIFLIRNDTFIEANRKYQEFRLISIIGDIKYVNSQEITTGFNNFFLHRLSKDYYSEYFLENINNEKKINALFRLKSRYNTNESIAISRLVSEYNSINTIIDDPNEDKSYDLYWYVENIKNSYAVLAELIPKNQYGHEIHNAKCGFICGLAKGKSKEILLIAFEDPTIPFDYKTYMRFYHNARSCEEQVRPYLEDIESNVNERLQIQGEKEKQTQLRSEFADVDFGRYIAEEENNALVDYYIDQFDYKSIFKNKYNLIVGRKGTGKTATLYYIFNKLNENKKNIVCLIQPENFDITGLLSIIKEFEDDHEQILLIESTWKFLILTEIGIHLYDKIIKKPIYAKSRTEELFIDFYKLNNGLFVNDFTLRLEEQVELLKKSFEEITVEETQFTSKEIRTKIAQSFHQGFTAELRGYIFDLLEKDNKIFVLIDNLDKTWKKGADIKNTSKFLAGLLNVSNRIVKDLSVNKIRHINIEFSMVTFLRSDIFKYIYQGITEVDKLQYVKLAWNDKDVLFRIIEERFENLSKTDVNGFDFWNKYVVDNYHGVATRDFIWNVIMPRPRDLIYFIKQAQSSAIKRRHKTIEASDIKTAYEDYSKWIFGNLIEENGITFSQMEDFLYSLIGFDKIIYTDEIKKAKRESNISEEDMPIGDFVEYLIGFSILGREIRKDEFAYQNDFEEDKRNKALASKLNSNRYKIHPALYPNLDFDLDS